MKLEDYPTLNEPSIMLVALKCAAKAPTRPEGVVDRLRSDLEMLDASLPDTLVPDLRKQVDIATTYLEIAGLMTDDSEGRYVTTSRGRDALHEHPAGIDTSVLRQYSSFREFFRRSRRSQLRECGEGRAAELRRSYAEGYAAFLRTRDLTDNPYPSDIAAHFEWEYGWLEAESEPHDVIPPAKPKTRN